MPLRKPNEDDARDTKKDSCILVKANFVRVLIPILCGSDAIERPLFLLALLGRESDMRHFPAETVLAAGKVWLSDKEIIEKLSWLLTSGYTILM